MLENTYGLHNKRAKFFFVFTLYLFLVFTPSTWRLAAAGIISDSFELKENTENENQEDKRSVWTNGRALWLKMKMYERKETESR